MTITPAGPPDYTPAFQTAGSSPPSNKLSYGDMYNTVVGGLLTVGQNYNAIIEGLNNLISQIPTSKPEPPKGPPDPNDPQYDGGPNMGHNAKYFTDCAAYNQALIAFPIQTALFNNKETYVDLRNLFTSFNPTAIADRLSPLALHDQITQADYDDVAKTLTWNDQGVLDILNRALGLETSVTPYPDFLKNIPDPSGSGQSLYDLAMTSDKQLNNILAAIHQGFDPDPNPPR